jgi:hypothetical protein
MPILLAQCLKGFRDQSDTGIDQEMWSSPWWMPRAFKDKSQGLGNVQERGPIRSVEDRKEALNRRSLLA